MTITVEPLDAPVGARVTGVDLSRALEETEWTAIHQAWLAHQVLVFPGQTMSEDDQIRFSLHWGEMPVRARYAGRREEGRRAHQSIMLVSNIREDGVPIGSLPDGEMMFHSDGSYDEHPYRYTTLYALEVPSRGGNTLFADMYGAYETLPDDLRRRLAGMRARHGYYAGRDVTPEIMATLGVGASTDCWEHPLFTAHEETGRSVLFASRLLTQCLIGLPEAESDELLHKLFDHAERSELIYEHVWQPGDYVIWDNRCINHARTDFPTGERRLLRRTTVQGVRPEAA
ncbi:MAG: TauD/TfdA family dioxygenase [Alphaproteobacteria bacterium]